MRARQHVGGLAQTAGVGERFAIGAENGEVLGIADGLALQHGDGLRIAVQRMQRSRIGQRDGFVLGVGVIAMSPFFGEASKLGVVSRHFHASRRADRAGDVGERLRAAAEGEQGADRDGSGRAGAARRGEIWREHRDDPSLAV